MPIYPGNFKNVGQTKNNSGKFAKGEPRFLVMHFTAGGKASGSVNWLFNKHSPASSAHFVVDRNGDVYQLSDTNLITWHAGKSYWKGVSGLNNHAIGVEIANWGEWRPGIGVKDPVAAHWLLARHKNGGPSHYWEPFPEPQIVAVENLTKWILSVHPTIIEPVGHDDIAPGRKSDPGPAFPMKRIQAIFYPRSEGSIVSSTQAKDVLIGGKNGTNEGYIVSAYMLNVREGPGTNFDILKKISPLKKGSKVQVLKEQGDWSFISTNEERGWVYSDYLIPA